MRNHKIAWSLKRNKVTLDIDIKVTLFLKGDKATLDIKLLSLSKKTKQLWSP